MTDSAAQITVYSDYVCPFCYLGTQALDQYRERRDGPLDVEWHPFDLRSQERGPDDEIADDAATAKDEAYFQQARENVRRLQERYDVEMAQELATDVDSWTAQQASLFVRETRPEQWAAFDAAIFDALWQDARDIGDPDVIVELASDVGLDAGQVREAIDSGEWADRLRDAHRRASDAGITGVPTFVADGHAARGAVPPEQLSRLVDGDR
jgi:predicted DsbA family dithiol-disulfide isomerase